MRITKDLDKALREVERQMLTNAELASADLYRNDPVGAVRGYAMACAYAIALKEIHKAAGDSEQTERSLRVQEVYARQEWSARQLVQGSHEPTSPPLPLREVPPQPTSVDRRQYWRVGFKKPGGRLMRWWTVRAPTSGEAHRRARLILEEQCQLPASFQVYACFPVPNPDD